MTFNMTCHLNIFTVSIRVNLNACKLCIAYIVFEPHCYNTLLKIPSTKTNKKKNLHTLRFFLFLHTTSGDRPLKCVSGWIEKK